MMQTTREEKQDEFAANVGHISAAMSAPINHQDDDDDAIFPPLAHYSDLTP